MAPIDPPVDDPLRTALTAALRARQPTASVTAAEALVQAYPRSALAWSGLADAWALSGRTDVAVDARRQALRLHPTDLTLQFNLGTTLLTAGDKAGALAVLQPLSRQAPREPRVHMNLGIALRDLGQLQAAATALTTARTFVRENTPLAAEIRWNRSLVHLMGGDLRAGLPAYEARRHLARFSLPAARGLPIWDGTGRPDTLLVIAEQGLGDTLQYARWIRRVRPRVGRLVFAVQKPLVPLLRAGLDGLLDTDDIVPLARTLHVPGATARAPLLSLPLLLGAFDRGTHVEPTPWLTPDPGLVQHWTQRLATLPGRFRVGIVWQGNPSYKDDRNRSVPLRHYAPLAAIPGVTLLSLQKRHGRDQLASLPQVIDLHDDLDEATGPFLDTAAVMQAADLVVTSDTATLHLAGALGVPTLAAIAHIPDWRFGLRGDQLPEYPRVRLVRQPRPGDWDAVVHQMAVWVRKQVS